MRYVKCPKQFKAEQAILAAFSDCPFIIFGGAPQTGKTTIVRRLLKSVNRKQTYAAYLPGAFTSLYSSVNMAFAAALGLPLIDSFTTFRSLERMLEDLIAKREFRLFLDDAGVHFGGGAVQRNASIELMQSLLRRFSNLKVVFVSDLRILDSPIKKVVCNQVRYIDIDIWEFGDDYRDFIGDVGVVFGFKRSQLVNDAFLAELLRKSQGATGALVHDLKMLSNNPDCRVSSSLSVAHLRNMWKYRHA